MHKFVANHAPLRDDDPAGARRGGRRCPSSAGSARSTRPTSSRRRSATRSSPRAERRAAPLLDHAARARAGGPGPRRRRIEALGGEVHGTTPLGFRIEATLTLEQVWPRSRALDDVMFIDRKSALEVDMDIVREIGGAELRRDGRRLHRRRGARRGRRHRAGREPRRVVRSADHPRVRAASVDHGTSVYGILFAQGADPQARGLIPDGVGIFAYSDGLLGGGTDPLHAHRRAGRSRRALPGGPPDQQHR